METKEVKTSMGIFLMKEPSAGVRNRALIKAETKEGFKATIFLTELLPKCIAKRPVEIDDAPPIEQVLDSLSMADYDKLSQALNEFLQSMQQAVSPEVMDEKKA